MTDTFDELRIIAKDRAPLCEGDWQTIARGADELELMSRTVILLQQQLIESQAQRIALNDVLLGIRRRQTLAQTFPKLGMTLSGPLTWMTR